MKKCLAILLCLVMLSSFACMFAFAEDTAPVETVTVTFRDDDGTVLATVTVEKGKVPVGPSAPVKPRVDGEAEWAFDGWLGADGNKYYSGTLPAANEDMTYTATYKKLHDNTDEGDITIMTFLASIFARLNKIFAQISTYFEELTKSVQHLLG